MNTVFGTTTFVLKLLKQPIWYRDVKTWITELSTFACVYDAPKYIMCKKKNVLLHNILNCIAPCRTPSKHGMLYLYKKYYVEGI